MRSGSSVKRCFLEFYPQTELLTAGDYSTFRSAWTVEADHLIFDCGPHGALAVLVHRAGGELDAREVGDEAVEAARHRRG